MIIIDTKYKTEFSLDNPNAIKIFLSIIEEIIDKKIQKYMKSYIVGKVTDVAIDGTLSVGLHGDTSVVVTGLKNKTGEVVTVGQEVYVEKINGSTNNLVVTYTKV